MKQLTEAFEIKKNRLVVGGSCITRKDNQLLKKLATRWNTYNIDVVNNKTTNDCLQHIISFNDEVGFLVIFDEFSKGLQQIMMFAVHIGLSGIEVHNWGMDDENKHPYFFPQHIWQ